MEWSFLSVFPCPHPEMWLCHFSSLTWQETLPFFSVCLFSTRWLCWTSSVTGRRSVEWDCSGESTDCCGIAACAPHTEAIPHLYFHPSLYLFYLYFFSDKVDKTTCGIQDVGLRWHCPVFALLLFFLTYFQTLHKFLFASWPVLFKELWTKGLRPLSWAELLFYQWIHMVRVAFHGCITLHACILNFTYHPVSSNTAELI